MTDEQAKIKELREAYERQKWFEDKAAESLEKITYDLLRERKDTEKYLAAYTAALEQYMARKRD